MIGRQVGTGISDKCSDSKSITSVIGALESQRRNDRVELASSVEKERERERR